MEKFEGYTEYDTPAGKMIVLEPETKIIPHQKTPRKVRPPREPKPKRYQVQYFSYNEDRWIVREDYRLAHNAKYWARYWEELRLGHKWRVVDTRG